MTYTPDPENLWLDQNVITAIASYFMYGLEPGSFGYSLILGDYDEAMRRAHALLRKYELETTDKKPVTDMMFWVSCLPSICRGSAETYDKWIAHFGLKGASAQDKILLRLGWDDTILGPYLFKEKQC